MKVPVPLTYTHFHIPSPWRQLPLYSVGQKKHCSQVTLSLSAEGHQSRKGKYGGTRLKSLVWELAAKVSHSEVVSWLVEQQPPSWTCVRHSSLFRHFRHLCATVSPNRSFTRRQKGQRLSPPNLRVGNARP